MKNIQQSSGAFVDLAVNVGRIGLRISINHQNSFSGTESVYGARPAPDRDGIYPYVYNMSAKAGMRVRDQGVVYRCTSDCPDMLWPPSELAAHFEAEG